VSALSDFDVTIEPVKSGRKVTGVRLSWNRKDPEGVHLVWNELQRPKVGRKVRMAGTVEMVDFAPPALPNGGLHLKSNTFEEARQRFPGYDIYRIEREWRDWSAGKELPRNPDAAFLAFFAKYAERHPHSEGILDNSTFQTFRYCIISNCCSSAHAVGGSRRCRGQVSVMGIRRAR
jgi:hypothetical protein